MAFGFAQNAWQAGTQSPWRQGYASMSPMRPGAGLAPIYQPSEFAQATPAAEQNTPAQVPFGGFMPIPMPMPMPMAYPQQQTARPSSHPFGFEYRMAGIPEIESGYTVPYRTNSFNQYPTSQYGILGGF